MRGFNYYCISIPCVSLLYYVHTRKMEKFIKPASNFMLFDFVGTESYSNCIIIYYNTFFLEKISYGIYQKKSKKLINH